MDILTEVYGYSRARYVVWLTLLASVLAGLRYQLVAFLPAAPFFHANEAYGTVFHTVPRILLVGWVAVFFGDIANNYVLAKMTVLTNGKMLCSWLISSTIVGQGVNTSLFYIISLYGILRRDVLLECVVVAWLVKIIVAFVMMPVTYVVVARLKKTEGIEFYDRGTNFNPFIIRPERN